MTMTAPPSSAYKIVSVPENYRDLIGRRGLEGTCIGGSEAESPWIPFGDNAAIRHLAFDVRQNVYCNILWIKSPGVIGTHKHRGMVWRSGSKAAFAISNMTGSVAPASSSPRCRAPPTPSSPTTPTA